MKISFIITYLFLFGFSFGQVGEAFLHGIVINGENHSPLPNANVRITSSDKSISIFDATDLHGEFLLKDFFPKSTINHNDSYTIEVSYIGYKSISKEIPPKDIGKSCLILHLYPLPVQTSAIIITGEHTDFLDNHSNHSSLKGKELERDLGQTLASTLKNETGISIRSMGPAPARPVIRGLGNDRIFISEDGIKSGDLSSTSPDHSVAIEPFTVERIEVIRGPKVLLFNSNSLGGVVNTIRHEIPISIPGKFQISSGLNGELVNKGILGAVTLTLPVSKFVFRGELSRRKAGNMTSPAGILKNSDISVANYSAGLSYINPNSIIGGSIREYYSDYGIPGGFIGGHLNGVDISMFKRLISLKSNLNFNEHSFLQSLNLDANRNYYRHLEYETDDIIGAEFTVFTHSFKAIAQHRDLIFFNEGSIGISGEYQDFNIGGYVFTAPTKQYNISLFAYEKHTNDNFSIEFSARMFSDSYRPKKTNAGAREKFIKNRDFLAYSASISAVFLLFPEIYGGLNISQSSRVPSIEELYSEGPHLAAYSYEIGNPDLNTEKGYGIELFIYKKSESIFANFNLYGNFINSYIIPRNTGKINYSKLLPIYQSSQVDAGLFGFETQIEYSLSNTIKISSSLHYTYGIISASNSPLPAIPPIKSITEAKYQINNFIAGLVFEIAGAQNRVDIFEEKTVGYGLLNSFIQYSFLWDKTAINVSLALDNITDKEYRNHLSRIKSVIPESGRNLRATVRFYY